MYLFTRSEKSSALAYQPCDLRCHMLIGTASKVGLALSVNIKTQKQYFKLSRLSSHRP